MKEQQSTATDGRVERLSATLRLTPGPDGRYTGPWHDAVVASGDTVMRWRTVLIGPHADPVWRCGTGDTVLFSHEGTAHVLLQHGNARVAHAAHAVLGKDLAAGQVPQYTVPAGSHYALVPPDSGHVLLSEAHVPGEAECETTPFPRPRLSTAPSPVGVPSDRSSTRTAHLLDLAAHVEGGYFRQMYESTATVATERGIRTLANTIYYLLDRASPVGHLHGNVSDITHFLHRGGPVHYLLLSPDGELHERVLGLDVERGEVPAFTCPGAWWKTSFLPDGVTEGLISEIVAPGFDFADQRMARAQDIAAAFPEHARRLERYVSH
ncbi:cupin domain-containing protein [Streptomyces corynorhini]|uniref:DUF985 domain-containing protein n=1 Tax=Streptomyces corynorhini TaxID=2282652 RepID=A0A370AWF1_9ACTN|nr:cupin domain-containing protein [Streptomyces corynorhini]RDG32044.1 hypothetical protein DVH02_32875 [Streptomyces corynorhini]